MRKMKNILIVLLILIILCGCSDDGEKTTLVNAFNVTENDIDFTNEITGHLNEENAVISVANTESDGLLRWGLKRNKGKAPDADPGAPELLKEYNSIYLMNENKKEIYLTFDEGYEAGHTGKILDTLKEKNVKAVFFITGPYLNEHENLVKRMVEEGHEVGNHTVNHPSLGKLSKEKIESEILELERPFKEKFNKEMNFLRPPMGEYSKTSLEVTDKLGYINMFWSFAYDDWDINKVRGAEYAVNMFVENLHNGEIALLHAVSKDNAEGLGQMIDKAREKGYEFGNPCNITKENLYQ